MPFTKNGISVKIRRFNLKYYAGVVELVDTLVLGTSAARRAGSTPVPGIL